MKKGLIVISLILLAMTGVLGKDFILAAVGFIDEFDGPGLEAGWTWTDPTGTSSYNFTDNPGHLRIQVPSPGYDMWLGNQNSPRITRAVTGDFIVETKIDNGPQYFIESAGILVFSDSQNLLRLERVYHLGKPIVQTINFPGISNGIWWEHDTPIEFAATTTYLRLTRVNDYFAAEYSVDGVNWEFLSAAKRPMPETVQVGLHLIDVPAQSENVGGFFADFDYFKLTPVNIGKIILR